MNSDFITHIRKLNQSVVIAIISRMRRPLVFIPKADLKLRGPCDSDGFAVDEPAVDGNAEPSRPTKDEVTRWLQRAFEARLPSQSTAEIKRDNENGGQYDGP